MKHKMKIGLLLLTVMAMVLVPGASAYRTYVPSVASSCSVCHVNPEGGLPLNAVGEIYRDTGSLPPTTSNKAPVADDQAVTTPEGTPGAVTLTASDPDGNSLTFAIVSNPTNGKLSGTAPSLTYTPNTGYSGADSFTYKANDGKLDSNVAKVSITVTSESTNLPPVPTEKATVKFVVTDDKKGNPIKNAKVSLGKITIKT
ncbi:MAG: cadherin-like domain-containing protein, partial [Candidatus Methanoperedens sp.]|nr:cadherin-like domain-containing protein [Candidatus Methanoperedens sp.]